MNADTPISYPAFQKVYDLDRKYCAYVNGEIATVYKYNCVFGKELYSIEGSYKNSYLRNNGSIFIAAYAGLNLIPLNSNLNKVMFTVWLNGKKTKEYLLGDIIKSLSSLQKTSSHYSWGVVDSVTEDSIYLTTVEGKVQIDFINGTVRL